MHVRVQMGTDAAMVVGALVADAASLGLHWIYDRERIASIEKEIGLAFVQPNANHYAGVKGYFAHGNKLAGESSGYGEVCLQMLKHFAQHGDFDRRAYQQEFSTYFGPGGRYVGYVDSPMRKTLQGLLAENVETFLAKSGADDDQLSALATLPALVAAHRTSFDKLILLLEAVVPVTHNNDTAVAAAQCVAGVLSTLRDRVSIQEALARSVSFTTGVLADLLTQALAMNELDSIAAAENFGSACHITQGLPIVFHIANCAPDYMTAIDENIRIGGDSCGRAIILGAMMAAQRVTPQNRSSAIPFSWITRCRSLQAAADALELIGC